TTGGATNINSIEYRLGFLTVNGKKIVFPFDSPNELYFVNFDDGDITEYLHQGVMPRVHTQAGMRHRYVAHISDKNGFASGVLSYHWNLPVNDSVEFSLEVPFHGVAAVKFPNMEREKAKHLVDSLHGDVRNFWQTKINSVMFDLPKSAEKIINTLKTNLAYILINRDKLGIQPGSRSYERSWIRDGALTSTALLYLGFYDEVHEYLDWFAKFQFPDGKIPCVVDTRGADPVPENDSHGEFIYAILQYYHFTKDRDWLNGKFEHVLKTTRYIQLLRRQRKTDEYKNGTPEQQAMYGLVPESISHEGYSAKPMHSYWDDFFILRGLNDATTIAGILEKKELETEFKAERDDFEKCLYASIVLAMKNKQVDYIPGCVELGDFDATSTAIAINPIGELGNLPEPEIHNTFDRYYKFFEERRDGKLLWENYTPYEVRIIGVFIYLNQKERAHELLNFFLNDQRPKGWNHWAEVVWKDSTVPKFIGDMPHTWVASDFIRAVRSMFVYERERDSALVVGAGVVENWIDGVEGFSVSDLPTYYGKLSYSMKKERERVVVDISGGVKSPTGNIVLKSPINRPIRKAFINGIEVSSTTSNEILVKVVPAKIDLYY
ncbi:MAG: coagulation factor 5/8 type domain-containing protein, partial [Ignavibacteriae bacterium]|nr:coagulation factor 5/8 type domain-containing protein [Ignavibacteriota bacterium]